jgi:2-polyprenyl-6-hydroxyphenyl methylase / 3-demethylubiquinone-9 3-methyltransferase
MTAIASEIERFDRLSATWWDPLGPMRPLHVVNALRLALVVDRIHQHFDLAGAGRSADSLEGIRVLDIGCGGGLLSEPLAQRGAQVVGVDASPGNVGAARLHAGMRDIAVDYRVGEPHRALSAEEHFDVVLALEVVEHVNDVPNFLGQVARHVAPGGLLFASTIHRTWKSFLLAIVAAEWVLRVLPRGTHQWRRFVTPEELADPVRRAGLRQIDLRGMRYLPILHRASWCKDTSVNYLATFTRAAGLAALR